MGLEKAVETIIAFSLLSSIVGFGISNVRNALQTDDTYYDEMMLAVGVGICYVFDIKLLESISGNISSMSVGAYIDYLIGGAAMGGSGAKLLSKLNKDVARIKKAGGVG